MERKKMKEDLFRIWPMNEKHILISLYQTIAVQTETLPYLIREPDSWLIQSEGIFFL